MSSGEGVHADRRSQSGVVDRLHVWAALESMAARLAALNATESQLSKLRGLLVGSRRQADADYLETNIAFHDEIIVIGGSLAIIEATRALSSEVRAVRRLILSRDDRAEIAFAGDLQIVGALERRDLEDAESLVLRQALDLAALAGEIGLPMRLYLGNSP